uniref:Microcephalin n=1 Tax=Pogona vitticeps TaxID=103695 RepID=A0ABM5GGE8_9SAUR
MELVNGRFFLTDVVAYVEVWSSSRTENYSKVFSQQLLDMGAKVSKTFNKQVTHVIFKDGLSSTWNRAKKAGVKLVSVLWVEKCREVGAHVDESVYPAKNAIEGLPHFIKKHKCMQPKDFMEKTPENDRRLQRRLEIMAKELQVQKATIEMDTPVLLFEDNGSLMYSPASNIKYQCSAMERRIKDMKEKRENLSPTASQMSQEADSTSVTAVHEQIPVFTNSTCAVSSGEHSDPLNTSFANVLGNSETKTHGKEFTKCITEALSTTDVSVGPLWNSPVSSGDFKHKCPQQLSGRHFRKTLILPNSMESDFFDKRTKTEMLYVKKHNTMNDLLTTQTGNSLSHENSLNCSVSSEKLIGLGVVEDTSNNHIHSLINVSSIHLTPSPVTVLRSASKEQKKSRKRLSLRRSTSALCKTDSQNKFLQAILTPVEPTKQQDSSFEDYFSPSNVNKTKTRVSLPSSCIQELQFPNEVVYKSSFSESKPEAVLEESNKVDSAYSRKRKRVTEINKITASTDHMLSLMPQNKKTPTPNNMTKEKRDTAKTPNHHFNHIIKENICTSVKRCSIPGDGKFSTTDVKEHSCELMHDQTNESNGKLKNTGKIKKVLWSLEYGHWISEEPYELSVDFPAAPICRFQRYLPNRKDHQKLFSDQPVMFISHTSQPPYEKLCELVQLCGGKVSKTLRQAKICIGECKFGKHRDIPCLSEKWVLDSITQNKICPLENYMFQNKV